MKKRALFLVLGAFGATLPTVAAATDLDARRETAPLLLAAGPDTGAPSLAAPQPASPPVVAPDAPAQATAPAVAPEPVPQTAEAAEALAAAEALPTAIEDVQIVSPWSADGEEGVWRTVMVRSASQPERYRFLLQQIVVKNGVAQIKSTAEIKEIRDLEGAVVGYRADEQDPASPSSLTLFFEIIPSDGEIAETYELFFTQGQPYKFGPASN